MPNPRPGFSVVRLTQIDVVLNQRNQIVGIQNADGTETEIAPAAELLSADYVVTAQDDGKVYACTTALTMTFPAGLSPRPAVVGIPPPTGNLSIAVSGGAQVNGATSTLTRSRSSNPAGVVIQPYAESDGYGASGS